MEEAERCSSRGIIGLGLSPLPLAHMVALGQAGSGLCSQPPKQSWWLRPWSCQWPRQCPGGLVLSTEG